MSILEELTAAVPDPYFKSVLDPFPRTNLAAKLGITTTYLSMLMYGHKTPGKALKARIDELIEQIEAELERA